MFRRNQKPHSKLGLLELSGENKSTASSKGQERVSREGMLFKPEAPEKSKPVGVFSRRKYLGDQRSCV